jgi:DNA-binding SARP family transcriptional activator/tetratricopeptide (TPR) repeat protein
VEGVTIRLVGSFAVARDGVPVPGPCVSGGKARRLLMLLSVHCGQFVPSDQIVDVLWSDRPPRRPLENVATLISRLRGQLGTAAIIGGRDGYRLAPAPLVRVDLHEARNLVAEAARQLDAGEPALAAVAAARALELLGSGSLLVEELDADWATNAREDGCRLVREARHTAAAAALITEDLATAIRVSNAAVAADSLDETAHRLLMSAHNAAGEPARALAVYEQLRVTLAAELGVDPAPQTRAIHLAVLREQRPSATAPVREKHLTQSSNRPGLPGREAELDSLRAAWISAAGGEPSLILIVGEAGIGKTRLAAEASAAAEATGALVLQARCFATERSLFLQPFLDAISEPIAMMSPSRLRELVGAHALALAGLIPKLEPMLGPLPAGWATREVEVRQAYEAVTHLVTGLAAQRCVLLFLDDLQNAGLATVELLHHLARHASSARLLITATVRTEEGLPIVNALHEVAVQVELGPLSADAVMRLATDAGVSERADAILRRTRGHTLFVVETLRGLAAGRGDIPDSLQQAVLARLRQAGSETEESLRAGAVLGASVEPRIVAGLLDIPAHTAARRLDRATATRLVAVAGHNYEFANDLVQEILYASTPAPTRLAYHRRAADLLTDRPESMATHAAAAQDWPRAARAYLLAGEQSAGRYASADAEILLNRAVDAAQRASDLEVLGRAYVARGRIRALRGSYRLALGDFRAAVITARQARDLRLEMAALRELGYDTSVSPGAPIVEVVESLRGALSIAGSLGDRAAQVDLLARLAVVSTMRLQFTKATAFGRRAVQLGRATGNDHVLALALDGLKTPYAYAGELAPLAGVLGELDPLLRRLGDLHQLEWAVFESAFSGIAAADWSLATTRIREAIDLNQRSECATARAWFLAHLGWIERMQGRTEQALRHGREAVALGAENSSRWWQCTAIALLAATLRHVGRHGEATQLLRDAESEVAPDRPEFYRLCLLAPLAELTGSRAVLDEADMLLAGISAPAGSAWLLGTESYLAIARSWLDHDEPSRSQHVLAALLAAAERQAWVPILASGSLVAARAAAALGDHAAAATQLGRAATLASRHGMPDITRDAERYLASLPST